MDAQSIDTAVRHDPRTAALCTGHKRDGSRCGAIAVKGTTKCRLHGGKSLRGIASPSFKHGRYTKDLPTRLAQRAAEGLADPRLLSLSPDIAVAQAYLAELFQRVDTGESGACWQELGEAMEAFEAALAGGDLAAMDAHFQTMRALRARGSAGVGVWEEIRRGWETLGKLVKTETDTMLKLQQMITVQQALVIQAAQTEAIVRAVQAHADVSTGRKILMDVQTAFTKLATFEER
jgi:hypothetical protein